MKQSLLLLLFLIYTATNAQCGEDVYLGESFTILKRSNGVLHFSGRYFYNTMATPSSTVVNYSTDWKQVSAGSRHVMALKNAGTLWGWGSNENRQLGVPTSQNVSSPIQIGTANDWKFGTTGYYSTYLIKNDGSLWVCGASEGNLG
ncbi:MAG: hypothetical protein ACO1N9_05695 [Flavobacterium sp.]